MSLKTLQVRRGRVLAKWQCLVCRRVQMGYASYQLSLPLECPEPGTAPAVGEYPEKPERLGSAAEPAAKS
jgi:hypothetical protein